MPTKAEPQTARTKQQQPGSTASTSPADDLALFADKKLVVLGGYGAASSAGGQQQWRSMYVPDWHP